MELMDFSNPVMWLENAVVLAGLYFAYKVAVRWRAQITFYVFETARRVGGAYRLVYLGVVVIFALLLLWGLMQRFI